MLRIYSLILTSKPAFLGMDFIASIVSQTVAIFQAHNLISILHLLIYPYFRANIILCKFVCHRYEGGVVQCRFFLLSLQIKLFKDQLGSARIILKRSDWHPSQLLKQHTI